MEHWLVRYTKVVESNKAVEESGCDLKRNDNPETGVIFVNDPQASTLFVDDTMWTRAKSEIISMPSLPGAGNTWVRLLVEKGSAMRTGSIFGDGSLLRMGFAGEKFHDESVLMIKEHYPALGSDLTSANRVVWLGEN